MNDAAWRLALAAERKILAAEQQRDPLAHLHGDLISHHFRSLRTQHSHDGGDRPHIHPDNPYVNPPPEAERF